MQFKNILLLLSTAIFVIACSSAKKQDVDDTASARTDLMQKGFLLSLPENEGWSVVKVGDYKVLLSKQAANGVDRYTIQTLVVTLPTFEDDNQFLEFIENRMTTSQQNSKVFEQNAVFFTGDNQICVQYNSKEERKSKSAEVLTLEVVSFTCRHPDNANAGVYIALSKSYAPGTSEEDLTATATEIFNRLYFTEL